MLYQLKEILEGIVCTRMCVVIYALKKINKTCIYRKLPGYHTHNRSGTMLYQLKGILEGIVCAHVYVQGHLYFKK